MVTQKGQVEIKTPSLIEYPDFDFDTHPLKVEQWIAELPLSNTGETARLIFNTLTKLNRHPIPIKNRVKILEIFRPVVSCLLKTIHKHFFSSTTPITAKNKTVAHLVRSLQEEMANGYKIVIMDSLNPENSYPDPKIQTMVAHRALYYLGGMLFTSYQVYMPPPAGVWRDTHQVFHFSEQFNLFHNTVNDTENDLTPWSSILDAYKKIALFALADPYHLSQYDMKKLRTTLSLWASSCQLTQYSDSFSQSDTILINPDGDLPPSKKVQLDEKQTVRYRSLDTTEALHKIRRDLSRTSEKKIIRQKNQSRLSSSLLTHLLNAWSPAIKQRSARKNREATLNGAFGLDAVHYFVNGNKNSFARNSETNEKNSLFHSTRFTVSNVTPKGVTNLDSINLWELNHPHPVNTELDDKELLPTNIDQLPKLTSEDHQAYYTDHCIVMNESAGGLCVQLPKESPPLIHIGELLCLQDALKQTDNWVVGVVRWIKNSKDEIVKIGVQLLSPSAEAVALSTYCDINTKPESKQKDYVRALLLPEIKTLKQSRSLLTRVNCYQSGSIVSLLEDNIEKRYTLLTMIEDAYGYNRFEVTPHTSEKVRVNINPP
ncbi:MAG: hypothetical protein L3J70_10075 [Gammaproteobacteria bacterium]|nr:hypothetical protein [Gammaproteobacteria bacterium]